MAKKIETIENRWDLLYRDYPDVYDEFASVPSDKSWIDVLNRMFDLSTKTIADVGSGSGSSSFVLAKYAEFVTGIEPEDSMRKLAIQNSKKNRIDNVEFKKGRAQKIPLKDDSMDMTIGVTVASFYKPDNIKKFVKEAKRITKKGGYIVTVSIAPKCYGGEIAPIILGKNRKTEVDTEGVIDKTLTSLRFRYKDYFSIQNYGTVKKAVRTYGFIFGKKAIEYLKKNNKTKIKWKNRIHFRQV